MRAHAFDFNKREGNRDLMLNLLSILTFFFSMSLINLILQEQNVIFYLSYGTKPTSKPRLA